MSGVSVKSLIGSGDDATESHKEHSLSDLKGFVDPEKISFLSGGGALGFSVTRQARESILRVTNPGVLLELLAHTETLRPLQVNGFMQELPIGIIQSTIRRRLEELSV